MITIDTSNTTLIPGHLQYRHNHYYCYNRVSLGKFLLFYYCYYYYYFIYYHFIIYYNTTTTTTATTI